MLKYIWAEVGDWLSHNFCILIAPLVFRGCFFGPLKICSWPSLLQLPSRTFIRPKNDTTYLAGHVDRYVRMNLSENSPLQS